MKQSKIPSLGSLLVSSLSLFIAHSVSADMQFIKAGFSIGKVLDEHVEFFDRDNDQLLDAITYGADNASLFAGQQNGFTIASVEAFSNNGLHTSKYITVADMNGDGYQDLITYPFRILLNSRDGYFPTIPNWHPFTMVGDYFKLQVTDLDKNGKADLFLSGSQRANGLYGGETILFMNVGYDPAAANRGYFAYQKQINFNGYEPPLQGHISGMKPNGVAIGDLNNDGMPDVIFINSARGSAASSNSAVMLNNGSGTLVFSQAISNAEDIALGDIDGDGDLDLYLARYGKQPDEIWLNNGQGSFTNSGQFLGSDDSINAAMADMDGDGDLDVVSTNHNVSGSVPHRIWLNDGNGNFSLSAVSFGSGTKTETLKLLDLDKDGDTDIVTLGGRVSHPQRSSLFISSNEVWLNQRINTDSNQLDFQSGIALCQSNPQDYGLYSQSQIDEVIDVAFAEGLQLCQDTPQEFGLFTQVDLDAQLQAGIDQGMQDCMTTPSACNLFDQQDLDQVQVLSLAEGELKGYALGQQACQEDPASCGLFSQNNVDSAMNAGLESGKQACIDQPASCGLFSQDEIDATENAAHDSGFNNGKQACVDDPASCGLFSQQFVNQNIEAIMRQIISELPKGQVKSVCKKYPNSPICAYAD